MVSKKCAAPAAQLGSPGNATEVTTLLERLGRPTSPFVRRKCWRELAPGAGAGPDLIKLRSATREVNA